MNKIGTELRLSGRVIAIIGLVMFYGSIFFAFAVGFGPPTFLSRAALVVPAVGCVVLFAALLWPRSYERRVAADVVLGILSLPPALVALFEATGGELARGKAFWVVLTIFLLPGALAVIVQAARTHRTASPAT
jgi:hypothetical protein